MSHPDHEPSLTGLAELDPRGRRDAIIAACDALSFAHAGICDAGTIDHQEELRSWIDAGRHGGMSYLGDRVDALIDPESVLEGVRSIICVADRYDGSRDTIPESGPARGRIARYARGRDYHDVVHRRLKRLAVAIEGAVPGGSARAVVDTTPLMERQHAERAGIGLVGKHTLLIRPGEGSWLLLGAVLTTLEVEPTPSLKSEAQPDPCGACTRCIDACPTDAITPFSVDATRCISYTTIEHREEIDPSLHAPTGDWLFGCDICQEVCPHNQPTRRSRRLPVLEPYAQRRDGFDLLEVLGWNEQDRRDAFVTSALKRARLAMIRRNAVICAGNALDDRDMPDLRARLLEIRDDENEDPLVRTTARAVLSR